MDAQGGNLSETVDFLRELLKEPEVARILSSRATSLAARREVSTCNTQAPQMPQSPCSMQGTIQSTDSTRESEHLANLEDTGGLDICLCVLKNDYQVKFLYLICSTCDAAEAASWGSQLYGS